LEKSVADADQLWLLKGDLKVLRGKNGRLFLDNDSNHVVKQFTGELLFSDQQLKDWQHVLENRVAWLERFGIPYVFLVPPTAHSVYPEDMPDEIPRGETRPVLQLIDHLASIGSFARVVYPIDEILAAKPDPLLFSPTDSHWSSMAAFLAYKRVLEEIPESVPVNRLTEEDLESQEETYVGDLGYKVEPKQESVHVVAGVLEPKAWLVHDNLVSRRGGLVITECPEAPPTTCLLLGDSFAGRLVYFFASSFGRFIYAYLPTLDYDLVRREKPDVVVSVMNERFLINVPYDVGAPSSEDVEREKKAKGELRTEVLGFRRVDERG
jgi:alginate O-acetyltransferase complex protein AlgJ